MLAPAGLGHYTASCFPTARQTPEGLVIARGAASSLWTAASWRADSQGRPQHGHIANQDSPMQARLLARVRAWIDLEKRWRPFRSFLKSGTGSVISQCVKAISEYAAAAPRFPFDILTSMRALHDQL